MPYNLDKESQSFWKIWKHGTHAKILSEILSSDEFHAQASVFILDSSRHLELIEMVVRMTGRRIGQEVARKLGASSVERDVDSDLGSAYTALPEGTAKGIAAEIFAHSKIVDLLREVEPEEAAKEINELTFHASRMTGRALGKLMGVDMRRILEFGREILDRIL